MARERCTECKEFNDDDGDCGTCVNCHTPLCIHDISDAAWEKIADRFDPPCDRWVIKDGRFDADATHSKGKV